VYHEPSSSILKSIAIEMSISDINPIEKTRRNFEVLFLGSAIEIIGIWNTILNALKSILREL